MKVQEINEGIKADYSLDGSILTISVGDQSINIDLTAVQSDTQQVIDISLDGELKLQDRVEKWYVANVVIPPQKTHFIDSGQTDENDNPVLLPETLPIDLDEVSLILWALPVTPVTPLTNEGGIS